MECLNQTLVVVKVGGTEGVDFRLICDDVRDLILMEFHIVLVHGGSAEANLLGEPGISSQVCYLPFRVLPRAIQTGKPWKFFLWQ